MGYEVDQILHAKVGHTRFHPHRRSFSYGVYYLLHTIPTNSIAWPWSMAHNRLNIWSFYDSDHGLRDGSELMVWFRGVLTEHGVTMMPQDQLFLIAHPRVCGYAFNPISYWLLYRNNGVVLAVCEVHNTFGDDHSYVFAHTDLRPIQKGDIFRADKKLYVSPFNTMSGRYTFSFDIGTNYFHSVINYYENNTHILNTYMGGAFTALSNLHILQAILCYPLMTLMVIVRIHTQAFRIRMSGIRSTLSLRPSKNRNTSSKATSHEHKTHL
jgi:uncharacterized protein